MAEDLVDHRRIFDGSDDLQGAAAVRAVFDGRWSDLAAFSWSFRVVSHRGCRKKAAAISDSWPLPGHLTVVSYKTIHSIK